MAERVIGQSYRDENAESRYPFGDFATLVANDGTALLTGDMFLDASLYPVDNSGSLYLSQIVVTSREVVLTVAGSDRRALASGKFDPVFPPDVLSLSDTYERPAGILVSEASRLSRFAAWPAGTFVYAPEATPFVPRCVIPFGTPGVRGLLLDDGSLLTGDVWLVGDNGVALRDVDGDIRVDLVGDPLFVRQLCGTASLFTPPRLLRTINGCGPNAFGGFIFTAAQSQTDNPALRIYPRNGSLVIELAGANDGGGCGT